MKGAHPELHGAYLFIAVVVAEPRNTMLYITPPPNPLLHAPRRRNNKWTPFPKYQETFNMMLTSACKPKHTAEHSLKTDKFVGGYR